MIPAYRAPLDAEGYMADRDDWAILVSEALRLAHFTGANVTVTFPDGKAYDATITADGASFGARPRHTKGPIYLIQSGAS